MLCWRCCCCVWLQQSTVAVVAALFSVSMCLFVCLFVCLCVKAALIERCQCLLLLLLKSVKVFAVVWQIDGEAWCCFASVCFVAHGTSESLSVLCECFHNVVCMHACVLCVVLCVHGIHSLC